MRLDLWGFDTPQDIWLPATIWGVAITLIYLLFLIGLFRSHRRDWYQVLSGHLQAFLAILILGSFAAGVLIVNFPESGLFSLPNLPELPPVPGAPIFGAVSILLIGGWLGPGPALIAGLLSGAVRSVWLSGRSMQLFEMALVAVIVTRSICQNYRGKGFALLRRPIVAGLVGGLIATFLGFLSLLAFPSQNTSLLPIIDFAWSVSRASLLPNLLEWTIGGLLIELVFYRLPLLRPKDQPLIAPPYESNLTRRFLYPLIPGFIILVVVVLLVVTTIATNSATDLTIREMAHDANLASDAIPDLNIVSINLLVRLAQDQDLFGSSVNEQQTELAYTVDLESELRTTAYFRQLILFDNTAEIVSAFPPMDDSAIPLYEEEKRAIGQATTKGHPRTTNVWITDQNIPILSHVEPIRNSSGDPIGALMGRVDLSVALDPVVTRLQGTMGAGRGFIVDEQWSIIAHPSSDRLMLPWVPSADGNVRNLDDRLEDDSGHAYEGVAPNGTRQLVYYVSGATHPWTVVLQIPYEHVLTLATRIAAPLFGFLIVAVVALALGLSLLIRQINQPLSAVVAAAGAITRRDLDTPVNVNGEDEVGQLGRAFETMRQSLQARLGELHLLLKVSQNVASSLDLSQGLPAILEGALHATNAEGVRIVAFAGKEIGPVSAAGGTLGKAMAPLDLAIARLLRRESILRVDHTGRTRAILDTESLADRVGALLALPLRTSQGYQGIIWIAFREPHAFTENEMGFMSTLASQASLLVENVLLFEAAEGGRRRLAAILASTSDAVIVTDRLDRVLLLNPAAESAFSVSGPHALEQPVKDVLQNTLLVEMLASRDPNITGEVQLPDGRTLYANVSWVSSDDSRMMGRVAVLRDITSLKELDDMKTDFVNTVSHDLRSPLTFMRGYVTMLPMVGPLTTKQSEYVEKILTGVDRMGKLVENLLNLAQIETGPEHIVQPIQVGRMVKATAERYRLQAETKGIVLKIDVTDQLPSVMGEPTLLRQAIANLIDNAVKYTQKGSITVRSYAQDDNVIIQIRDTGPGIAPTDQARLFEKFYRIKRRDAEEVKGSGLGLAIVKSIVERRHCGRTWVESRLGVGSNFYIALPTNEELIS